MSKVSPCSFIFFALFRDFYYNKDYMDEENNQKDNDWKILLLFLFILAAIVGAVWFFGWRVNQGEIIRQEKPIIDR